MNFYIKCKDFSDIKMEAASCASAVLRNSRFSTAVYEGKVVAEPAREDIDVPVNETLIVELYSK